MGSSVGAPDICREQDFLRCVSAHEIEIAQDNGLYRHVKFQGKEGRYVNWFSLITWPGHLCICGDYGVYVFSRVEDMFTFFRDLGDPSGGDLTINPHYWSEKVVSEDRSGVREYDPRLFEENIREGLKEYINSNDLSEEEVTNLAENVEYEVLNDISDERFSYEAAADFRYKDDFIFQDFWEVNCKRYVYQYLWCLYAIVWGIRQYDAAKVLQGGEA